MARRCQFSWSSNDAISAPVFSSTPRIRTKLLPSRVDVVRRRFPESIRSLVGVFLCLIPVPYCVIPLERVDIRAAAPSPLGTLGRRAETHHQHCGTILAHAWGARVRPTHVEVDVARMPMRVDVDPSSYLHIFMHASRNCADAPAKLFLYTWSILLVPRIYFHDRNLSSSQPWNNVCRASQVMVLRRMNE